MARSSQLAPNEVIGVMRDPHLIRLYIPNPQLDTGEALHAPPIAILKAFIRPIVQGSLAEPSPKVRAEPTK